MTLSRAVEVKKAVDSPPKERDGDGKYSQYFQEFCSMRKRRNGVIAGGGGKDQERTFLR